MRYGSVKHIALYYKAIPGMLRLLRQERYYPRLVNYAARFVAGKADGGKRTAGAGKRRERATGRDRGDGAGFVRG